MRDVRVGVVGGGVTGLTAALALADRGYAVSVLARRSARASVSAIAGAICIPYHPAEASEQVREWARRGIAAFTGLSRVAPDAGVEVREGAVLLRGNSSAHEWSAMLPSATDDPKLASRWGARAVLRASIPVVNMPTYLEWLSQACAAAGVTFHPADVVSLHQIGTDFEAVVNCSGLAARVLARDNQVRPIRGRLIRLRNDIGLEHWLLDDENSGGVTYVLPRAGEIIIGGTHEPDAEETSYDPAASAAMLERAFALEPSLRRAQVIAHVAGLRPHRPNVRVERDPDIPGLIHNYGHGGSGVTLSWGTAARVADLVAQELGH